MSDYVYTPDQYGNCMLCACHGAEHLPDGMCPDAPRPTEPDPDHLRD